MKPVFRSVVLVLAVAIVAGGLIFIFKIGGAFSTGVAAEIVLINGVSACNVYWVADGAISLGASATMKGTFIAHGANSMGMNSILEGRIFSTEALLQRIP